MSLQRLSFARALLLVGFVALATVRCGVIKEFTQPSTLSIQKFVATPPDVTAGGTVTLSWDVQAADSVEIDNGIGTVQGTGTKVVQPGWTTSFNLVARAGSSQATATVQVRVVPATTASPVIAPSPSPSPTASPSPSPRPSPSPTPTPVPSPTPTPVTCGAPATAAGNCGLTVVRPTSMSSSECLELNAVTVNQSCPVGFATARSLSFDLTAHTSRTLRWRRSVTSSDVLDPSEGAVSSQGKTSPLLTDLVLDSAVTIEIVDGNTVLLAFTLRHY